MRKVNKGVARCEVLTPRPTSAHTRVRVNISNQRPSPRHLVIKPIWTRAFSKNGLFIMAHTHHMCPNLKTSSLAGVKTRYASRFSFFSQRRQQNDEMLFECSVLKHIPPSFATDLSSLDKRKTRPCWSFNFNGIYQKPSLVHYHPGTHPSSYVALNYIRSENHGS